MAAEASRLTGGGMGNMVEDDLVALFSRVNPPFPSLPIAEKFLEDLWIIFLFVTLCTFLPLGKGGEGFALELGMAGIAGALLYSDMDPVGEGTQLSPTPDISDQELEALQHFIRLRAKETLPVYDKLTSEAAVEKETTNEEMGH